MKAVEIAGIPIGDGYPTRVCAELGTNHRGDLALATQMIWASKVAGCDMVKLQCRTPELAVPEAEWNELRDTPWGKMTKLKYRSRVEFNDALWADLVTFAASVEIPLFASVWDLPSLEVMEKVGSPCHKIPSPRLHDDELLKAVAWTAQPIILSTGISTMEEVEHAVNLIHQHSDGKPALILLQCTSAYPARADESNLRVIQTYKEAFGCPVGFSSHKIGIETCELAVAVGANLIERHMTLDRSETGSDHRMSSTPADLARLVKKVRYAEAALGSGVKCVYPSEEAERKRLRGSKKGDECGKGT